MARIPAACCTPSRWLRPHFFKRPISRHLVADSSTSSSRALSYTTDASAPNLTSSNKLSTESTKKTTESRKTFAPAIEQLVQSISQLSLLEAAELVDALKSRLKITEVAMPIHSTSPSSSHPTGSNVGESQQKKEEPQKPKEKTAFTLILTQIDTAQKAKVIKEIKTIMPNMNLVEAKKFVESLPKQLKENATKDEIEKLKKALESVGATVKVE